MNEILKIKYQNISNRALSAYPITYGVPLPQGVLTKPEGLEIRMPSGTPRPVQTRVLETHPDGSIKWLLLDFDLPVAANETGECVLGRTSPPVAPAEKRVEARETAEEIRVMTPRLNVTIDKRRFGLFQSWQANGQELAQPTGDIIVEDTAGKRYCASLAQNIEVRVSERGAQRVVVEARGRHTAEDGATLFDFRMRWTFRPNEPGVLLAYKFTNREEPETGVKVRSIAITIPTALGPETTKFARQSNHGKNWFSRRVEISEPVELFAAGALSEADKAIYGAQAVGKVLIRNFDSLDENLAEYPYFLRPGNARTDMGGGLRQMYPYLGMHDGKRAALGWFPEMEYNYPKSLRTEGNTLNFDIWPAWAGEFRVRRGQSKEHDIYIALADAALSPAELEGIYFDHEIGGLGAMSGVQPLDLTLDPDYVRSCRVLQLHRWLPYDEDRYLPVEIKLGSAGTKSSGDCRGMMDIGDYINPDRSCAMNNENDTSQAGIREYYRRAEPTMLVGALHNARHNAHVDFIAYDPDPLRQGTMPAHCPEHTDGATYPSHMWVEGLMAAYCLSGEPDFRDAALAVGENMLRWQKQNPVIFYADSRECGWPALAFLRLHEFTREQRWLDACEEIFQFYRKQMGPDGIITYALPHGVGILLVGYGEFMAWRSMFFYWERTGKPAVKEFLLRCLPQVYKKQPRDLIRGGGWASGDLFPAWAAFQLTGADKYIEDNYPFLRFLMDRKENFPWGGIDMHPYLAELDRRGVLERFCVTGNP